MFGSKPVDEIEVKRKCRQRSEQLRKRLRDVPLNCFLVRDLEALNTLVADPRFEGEVYDLDILDRLEKIATEFEKGGAR